jgi:predicted ArsR family transcriptional regulator
MSKRVGTRQYQILELLLNNKAGLSIDVIAEKLEISRNAVQQHIAILERDGYLEIQALSKTAGRPLRLFALTTLGINYFPKQYAWFSDLILCDLKSELGSKAFRRFLNKLGESLAQKLSPRFANKSTQQRVEELVTLMSELGYQATVAEKSEEGSHTISACNCIYHDLAQEHAEICEFDMALIQTLLKTDVELTECMAKGGHVCRFKISDSDN